MIAEKLAITLITALVTKGFEKLGEKTVESIWDKVRNVLVGDELIALNLLEKYPNNEDLRVEVAEKLQPRLESNPVAAKEFEELLKQIPSVQVKQNNILQSGSGNIVNQDISSSTINFNK